MTMQWSHDAIADALYITVSDAAIVRTNEIDSNLLVDEDAAGQPVGVEILAVSQIDGARLTQLTAVFPGGRGQWFAEVAGWVRQLGELRASSGSTPGTFIWIDEQVEVQSNADLETARAASLGLQLA